MDTDGEKVETGNARVGGAMKALDLVFVDLETTGLDSRRHEILEIAAIRVRQIWRADETPSFELVEEWAVKVHPANIESADPASLRVNGYTVTGWKNSVSIREALLEFQKRAAGAIMVAHNVAFDAEFLDAAFSEHELDNTMHYHRLDTVSMAYAKLHNKPDVVRYSLAELCKHFHIVNDDPHSALADARACYELFKKLIAL